MRTICCGRHRPSTQRIARHLIAAAVVLATACVAQALAEGGPYRAFAANGAASLLVEFDADTGAITRRRTNVHLGGVREVIAAPDLQSLHLVRESDVAVADLESLEVVGLEEVGGGGEYFAAVSDSEAVHFGRTTPSARAPDGGSLYVSGAARGAWYTLDVIDTGTQLRVRSIPLPDTARAIATSADGTRVYVATGDAVVVIDAVELEPIAIVPAKRRAQTLAVTADGGLVYVAGGSWTQGLVGEGVQPSLWALDTMSLRPLASIVPLGDRGQATQIVITPDSRRAIVALEVGGAVIVDLEEHRVLTTIPLGGAPLAVALAGGAWQPPPPPPARTVPDPEALHPCVMAIAGAWSQGTQLSLIDPFRHEVVSTLDLDAVTAAAGAGLTVDSVLRSVAADPVGGGLFAVFSDGGQLPSHLVGIDPVTGAAGPRLALGIGGFGLAIAGVEPIALAYSGRHISRSRSILSIIDVQRSQELADLEIAYPTGPIVISGDGTRAYVRRDWTVRPSYETEVRHVAVTAIDVVNRRVLFERPLPRRAGGMAVMADGNLWVDVADDTVEVIDGESGVSLAGVSVPITSWGHDTQANQRIAVAADGRFAYRVSGYAPGIVTVFDVARRAVVAQIPVDLALRDPVATHDGRTLYAITAAGTVAVVDLTGGYIAGEIPLAGEVRALLSTMTNAPCQTNAGTAPITPDQEQPPAAWPRIEVESTSADPGSTVAVAVRLATAGREVVGVEVEMRMEPPLRLEIDDTGSPVCRAGTDHGKQALFAARPAYCGGPGHCTGMRALVLSIGNQAPIPDGSVLFTCDVHIDDDVPTGIYRTRFLQVGASDAHGDSLPVIGLGGAIAVPAAAPQIPASGADDIPPRLRGTADQTAADPSVATQAPATATPTATFIPTETPVSGSADDEADSAAAGITAPSGGSGCQVSTAASPSAPALLTIALAIFLFLNRRSRSGAHRHNFARALTKPNSWIPRWR